MKSLEHLPYAWELHQRRRCCWSFWNNNAANDNASGCCSTSLQLWVAPVEAQNRLQWEGGEKSGGAWESAVFIFIRLHQIVASPQNFKRRQGLNSGLMKKSPASSYLLVCRQNPPVGTNIAFVRHMFLRRDPSKSCSINFTACFTDLPFPLCHFF